MTSTDDEAEPKISKEELEKILLGLIQGIAEVPKEEKIPDYREEIEKEATVIHVKLVSGHDVVGEFRLEDKDKEVLTLYYPMRLDLKPTSDSAAIRMGMELWSPFDTSACTSFLWQHVLSYGVVDPTVAEYHKWQWLYQNLYVRPSNKQAIGALNMQFSATLSKDNLEWKDRLKKLKAAGKIVDYPDSTQ